MKINKRCRGLQRRTRYRFGSICFPNVLHISQYKVSFQSVATAATGKKTVSLKQANHRRSIIVSEDQRISVFTTSSVSLVNSVISMATFDQDKILSYLYLRCKRRCFGHSFIGLPKSQLLTRKTVRLVFVFFFFQAKILTLER